MTTAAELMVQVGVLLNDEEHTRWPALELALWINDAMKAVVAAKPSARSGTRVLTLGAGTLQSIPAAAGMPAPHQLLDITRNIKSEGPPRVAGRTVKVTSREQLDAADPYWHDTTRTRPAAEVRHFTFDEQDPLAFYVWPPNDGTGKVEALCAEVPTLVALRGAEDPAESYVDVIDLPVLYDPALIDYVVFRAFSKDATQGDAGNGNAAYQRFATALGIKIQVEGGSSPNARRASP